MPLLTEALRGAGARLVDEDGRFLLEGGDLQARDVVARALWQTLAAGRRPLLDARAAVGDAFPDRYPTVFEACRIHGLDPRVEPMPVAPAAHYHMGGVVTDLEGRTSLSGLWAAGEVACTGVHGANRLASNSLLEALVFGDGVARSVSDALARLPRPSAAVELPWSAAVSDPASEGDAIRATSVVRGTMWDHVGLVRDEAGLRRALGALEDVASDLGVHARGGVPVYSREQVRAPRAVLEAQSLLVVGRLVATAALARPESRGAHYRTDRPRTDVAWRLRLVAWNDGGQSRLQLEPVAHVPTAHEVPA